MTRRKKIILLSAAGVLAAAVALAPTLASGAVRARVERELASRIDGTVAVGSARIGWFASTRIDGVSIDAGDDGAATLDIGVSQGILALAFGHSIDIAVSGKVQSAVDKDGRFGLLGRLKPAAREAPAPSPAEATPHAALGDRRISLSLAGLRLEATDADGHEYELDRIEGVAVLDSTGILIDLDAATGSQGRAGTLAVEARSRLAFTPAGEIDFATIVAGGREGFDARVSATDLHFPSGAGELVFEKLDLDAKSLPNGSGVEARLALAASVGGAAASTASATVTTGRLFAAEGAFSPDVAAVVVELEGKGLPLGALGPLLPRGDSGPTVDLVRDLGRSLDVRLEKKEGLRARCTASSPQFEIVAESSFSPDGMTLSEGRIEGRFTASVQTVEAYAGATLPRPLALSFDGADISWDRSKGLAGLAGQFAASTRQPVELPPIRGEIPLRVERARLSVWKAVDKDMLSISAALAGNYGRSGPAEFECYGSYGLSTGELRDLALTGSVPLDAGALETLSNGAIGVSSQGATVRIVTNSLDLVRGGGTTPLVPARGNVRLELSGAIAVNGGATSTVINDLAADLSFPNGATAGSLVVNAKCDGAQTRVTQRFTRIPESIDDLPSAGIEGTVAVRGLDPSFIRRLAGGEGRSADLAAVLGRGKMSLDVRNRVEGDALVVEASLDAAAADAACALRWRGSAIDATAISLDAKLDAEALASLPLGEGVQLEPGVRVVARVPKASLAETQGRWALAGDLAGTVRIDDLRVLRAPGLAAPIGVARFDTDAVFYPRDERVTARGSAALASGAGEARFDLRWKNPAEARLFRGLEGSLSLVRIDVARVEQSFGAAAGAWSGYLGGAGACALELSEQGVPRARLEVGFPALRGQLSLEVPEEGARRIAVVAGSLQGTVDTRTLARLAGIDNDPRRRIVAPMQLVATVAAIRLPLDAQFAPVVPEMALNLSASATPLELEVFDAGGAKTRIATQPLTMSLRATRLADEAIVAVRTDEKAVPDPARVGRLEIDARIRGAVAARDGEKAEPIVDGEFRAEQFPAAALDAVASTGGAMQRYLGDTIDARITAREFAQGRGSLAASLRSAFAGLDAPEIAVSDGFVRVAAAQPLTATFQMSPAVRQQLLASIHPVFSDVNSTAPARFTLDELAWPLDGDRRRFDASFRLDTGEVRIVNSGLTGWLLSTLGSTQASGFDAFVDPLRGTIKSGRLTYKDFALRTGRTQQGTWRTSLVFSGDIDLASKPIRVNSITTALPLRDIANWSSDARRLFDSLNAAAPSLVQGLVVGVELSGPLFDASGRLAKLEPKPKLPDFAELVKDNPGALLQGAGDILDAIRNRDRKKSAPPPPPPAP
ncbi:MAG: hypothetical protein ACO3IB_03330 [Phycisphaerales bacterium]